MIWLLHPSLSEIGAFSARGVDCTEVGYDFPVAGRMWNPLDSVVSQMIISLGLRFTTQSENAS